ncbi:MAG TPA: hypothetical protein PKH98_03920, partial [Candidatus Omnitrophota bacterium]|nr:hypothetical protein [Candidatus Omnitrophota bacterium]
MSGSKNIYDTFLIIIIWFVIVVVNVFRFYNLENVPFGFHVDELASATTVQCLATQERGIFLQKPKIFFDVNYGTPKAFLYIYPSVLWTKIFGFSIASFRAYTVFGYLIT